MVEMKSLFLLASAIKGGRRRRLQTWLALNNQTLVLNLVCLLLLVIPKGTSQFLVQFFVVVGFFKIHLLVFLKNMTHLTLPNYMLLNTLHSHPFPLHKLTPHTEVAVYALQQENTILTSSEYIPCSRSKRNTNLDPSPFCSKIINKLCEFSRAFFFFQWSVYGHLIRISFSHHVINMESL